MGDHADDAIDESLGPYWNYVEALEDPNGFALGRRKQFGCRLPKLIPDQPRCQDTDWLGRVARGIYDLTKHNPCGPTRCSPEEKP